MAPKYLATLALRIKHIQCYNPINGVWHCVTLEISMITTEFLLKVIFIYTW